MKINILQTISFPFEVFSCLKEQTLFKIMKHQILS